MATRPAGQASHKLRRGQCPNPSHRNAWGDVIPGKTHIQEGLRNYEYDETEPA